MRDGTAIELDDVWRRYRVRSRTRPTGLRASLARDPLRRHPDGWVWALRGVDLSVGRGEALAVIGRNGAGKSTLLRLIGGVGRPDRGSVHVSGRVGALVDLGQELHGDLTGRQNAEVVAVVAGLTRRELRERFDEIIAFADLAEFVDEPLFTYSDGMRARLAFSVMVHLDPDVLLVDEVLSVGDAAFQRRSIERMSELRARGVAVLFVSHDLNLVRDVCTRAAWLERGALVADGDPAEVVARYLEGSVGDRGSGGASAAAQPGLLRSVRLLDAWGAAAGAVRAGDGLVVEVEVTGPALAGQEQPNLQVRLVRGESGLVLVDTSSPVQPGRRVLRVAFDRLDLAAGPHRVEVALHTADWSSLLDGVDPMDLVVEGHHSERGVLAPPHEWTSRPSAR